MYMLDSNVCVQLLQGYDIKLANTFCEEIKASPSKKLYLSSIAYGELYHGALKSDLVIYNLIKLKELLRFFIIIPFDIGAAKTYGRVRLSLEGKGKPIGPNDFLIASHAVSLGAICVSNNLREFDRIADLRVEDWQSPMEVIQKTRKEVKAGKVQRFNISKLNLG